MSILYSLTDSTVQLDMGIWYRRTGRDCTAGQGQTVHSRTGRDCTAGQEQSVHSRTGRDCTAGQEQSVQQDRSRVYSWTGAECTAGQEQIVQQALFISGDTPFEAYVF